MSGSRAWFGWAPRSGGSVRGRRVGTVRFGPGGVEARQQDRGRIVEGTGGGGGVRESRGDHGFVDGCQPTGRKRLGLDGGEEGGSSRGRGGSSRGEEEDEEAGRRTDTWRRRGRRTDTWRGSRRRTRRDTEAAAGTFARWMRRFPQTPRGPRRRVQQRWDAFTAAIIAAVKPDVQSPKKSPNARESRAWRTRERFASLLTSLCSNKHRCSSNRNPTRKMRFSS